MEPDQAPSRQPTATPQLASAGLGPFRVIRLLDAGSTADVYLAEATRELDYAAPGDQLVLKVFAPRNELGDPSARERFRREGELGSRLDHDSLVRTFERLEVEADGHHHELLVQEYVEGDSLRTLMDRRGRLAEPLVRDIAAQVARGLSVLHDAGLVHRDLKPHNVLITSAYEVKLADFGVVNDLAAGRDLTKVGQFVGSPHYAAPEQFQGEVGPAADLYSLGVVMYEAATGVDPFPGETFEHLMWQHIQHVPPTAAEHEPSLSPFFCELVAELLEKQPDLRLQPATLIATTLESGERAPWWHERDGSPHTPPELATLVSSARVPLMGREQELSRLRDHHAAALDGRGTFVLVLGEAGVGKSRLLAELVHELESAGRRDRVIYGAYQPEDQTRRPSALAASLVAHFGPDRIERELMRLLPSMPQRRATLAAWLGIGPSHDDEADPAQGVAPVQTALCQLARAMADQAPLVWVSEDAHLASDDEWRLLAALGRVAEESSLLLLASSRVDPRRSSEPVVLPVVDVVSLLTLDVDASLRMVASFDGRSPDARRRIVSASGGNPFLLLAMATSDEADNAPDADGTAPDQVREVLRARLRTIARADRRVLEAAAIQGVEFDPALVAATVGRSRLEVLTRMAELARHTGVVHSLGGRFRFGHHLLHEAVYEGNESAATDHAQLAGALASTAGASRPGELAAQICEHFLRGGRPSEATPYLLPAIRFLDAGYRSEAIVLLSDAADKQIPSDAHAIRARMQLIRARALRRLGRRQPQRLSLEATLAHAVEAELDDVALEARLGLGRLLVDIAEYELALDELQRARGEASRLGNESVEGRARAQIGRALGSLGRLDEARDEFELALAQLRASGDQLGQALALNNYGQLHNVAGQPLRALPLYQAAVELYRAVGDSELECHALGNIAAAHGDLGDSAKLIECSERHLAQARSIGYVRSEAMALGNLGAALRDRGQLARSRGRLTRCLELCRAIEDQLSELICIVNLGQLAHVEGDLEAARSQLEAARDGAQRLHLRHIERHAICSLAETLFALGSLHVADAMLVELVDDCREHTVEQLLASAATRLGVIRLRQGRARLARELFEEGERCRADDVASGIYPLPAAYLALMGERSPESVRIDDRARRSFAAEAHLVLHRAGHDDQLARAHAVLQEMSAELDEEARARFWADNPVVQLLEPEDRAELDR